MARALLGYVGTGSEQTLLCEVSRLRRRIRELETELAEARSTVHALDAGSLKIEDIELHRITEEAEPALT